MTNLQFACGPPGFAFSKFPNTTYNPIGIKALLSNSVNVVCNSWVQLIVFHSERSCRAYSLETVGNLPKFDSCLSEKNKEW